MTEMQSETSALTPRFDTGPSPRGSVGFVCLANAGLTERDMFSMRPEGVGLHFTRIRMGTQVTVSNLAEMEDDLEVALNTFMPGRPDLDVICYNCTSGSLVIGEDVIQRKIEANRDSVIGTTMLSAVVAALKALQARKIVIGTAYTPDIDKIERQYFESKGYDVLNIKGLGLLTDAEMNRVSPDYLVEFATSIDHPDADAIFLSCGALRSTEVISKIESIVGKPVIGSNHATFWHCLRLAGINDRITGFGQLLEDY